MCKGCPLTLHRDPLFKCRDIESRYGKFVPEFISRPNEQIWLYAELTTKGFNPLTTSLYIHIYIYIPTLFLFPERILSQLGGKYLNKFGTIDMLRAALHARILSPSLRVYMYKKYIYVHDRKISLRADRYPHRKM